MRKISLAFLLFSCLNKLTAQTTSVDALALKIPEASTYATSGLVNYLKQNFYPDSARVRAIYVWIANNIAYDVPRLLAKNANGEFKPQPSEDVLKTRAAVCQGYATLFVDLCTGLGVKAVLISGYGKIANTITPSHAWVGVEMNGNWYLFDPTWGAGYVQNNRFIKSFNNIFFKVPPEQMIKDHMPFDPMYQFVNHIVSNKEFLEGQTAINTNKPFFNYRDSIAQFAHLSEAEKFKARVRRLEANGVQHEVIRQELMELKKGTEVYGSNDKFEQAVTIFNKTTDLYNEYIKYKNQKFNNIEDNRIKEMMDTISYQTKEARNLLFSITPKNDAHRQALTHFHQNIESFQKMFLAEKDWVSRYISMDKVSRKQFFR
jgi:transglutaminase/protease-like cytokinesis protein 3